MAVPRRVASLGLVGLMSIAPVACGRIAFDPVDDAASSSTWWSQAWAKRIPIVVDHTRVAGDLADFPVLVELNDPALASAQPTGADLRFVDADGRELAYQIETFSPPTAVSVPPPVVQLVAWVKLPAVSATTDTVLYLYLSNPVAPDGQQPAAVWSGYAATYHFGEVSLDVSDSTGNNPGTNNGALPGTGQILGGAHFPGGPNITAGTAGVDASAGGSNTVSFWMNYAGAYGKALFAFVSVSDQGYDLWMESAACFGFNTENGDGLGIPATTLVGRWVHVAAVFYNGVPDATHNKLWIDGVPQSIATCFGAPVARGAGGTIAWASLHGYEFTGFLDEARIAPGVLSDTWVATEFANESSPSTFVRALPAELAP